MSRNKSPGNMVCTTMRTQRRRRQPRCFSTWMPLMANLITLAAAMVRLIKAIVAHLSASH
jgi:hypothetical protein